MLALFCLSPCWLAIELLCCGSESLERIARPGEKDIGEGMTHSATWCHVHVRSLKQREKSVERTSIWLSSDRSSLVHWDTKVKDP